MTESWIKLIELEDEAIWRGAVFRLPASWPYEDAVDFMIVEDARSPTRLALIVSSGYKAGCQKFDFPAEALPWEDRQAISKAWIINHWNEWFYDGCKPAEVMFSEHYSTPTIAANPRVNSD